MIQREDRKWYLLYPEDRSKSIWDSIVSLVLLIMCITTPIYISFQGDHEGLDGMDILNITMDIIFGIDIIVVFLSAYYDDDFKIVDNVRTIAV